MEKQPVLVLGAGSWGTALALVLARNGLTVYLWDGDETHTRNLLDDHTNEKYLPGIPFPDKLIPSPDLSQLPGDLTDVIIAVPCEALRQVCNRIASFNKQDIKICLACKGLEPDTLTLNNVVVNEILGDVPLVVLSGPSFAKEVANGLPTAVTLASADMGSANYFSELFHSETFRIYTHDDLVGVQIGGAIKNVMAIAAGIADGLGFGANTRAALITRGLTEIMRLGLAMGGRQETFMGLAGLGDLVLTCTDDQSRNRRFGLALAQGKTPQQAKDEIGQAVEGLRTAAVIAGLAARYKIEMPISEQVLQVIDGKLSPEDAVKNLLAREKRNETEEA